MKKIFVALMVVFMAGIFNFVGQNISVNEVFAATNRENRQLASKAFEEGNKLFNQKNYQGAIAKYTESIKLDPDEPIRYQFRGDTYIFLNNYQKAIEDYNQAIKLSPKYEEAYVGRGNAYRHLQNYEKAISDFTEAIKLNPNNAFAYKSRSICHTKLGNIAEAQADIKKARQLEKNG